MTMNTTPSEQPDRTWRSALIASGMTLIVMLIGLAIEQRALFCGCGDWSPWISDVDSRHCSQHMFDAYSFSHVLHGVVFFAALWPVRDRMGAAWRLWACVLIEAGWEVLENSAFVIHRYRTATIALGYEGDSITNSLCDVLSCVAGYWLASRIVWKWSAAFFVGVELLMMAAIRDSLTLNVVMLVYPLDVIKQWQLGG